VNVTFFPSLMLPHVIRTTGKGIFDVWSLVPLIENSNKRDVFNFIRFASATSTRLVTT
jgi:hypothetical protein